jgi:hypothetical protein
VNRWINILVRINVHKERNGVYEEFEKSIFKNALIPAFH